MADSIKAALYLSSAMTTLKYVESKMDIGASNKFPNLSAAMCVGWAGMDGKMRQDVNKDLAARGILPGSPPTYSNWKQRIDIEAYNAKSWGCGNCGEQASVAFVNLREKGILPLDYFHVGNFKHAFVIVGRDGSTKAADYTTWNSEAVMCDPWGGKADFVTSLASYFSGKTLTLDYRET